MIIATYKQQCWLIEICSKAMRSSDFNIEDTHPRSTKCIVYDGNSLSCIGIAAPC